MKLDKSERNLVLQDDILRYKKNKFAANFALLAIVFNCLYFMLFYSVNSNGYYTPVLGLSVIVNLFVLLFGFLSSEGIKNYNGTYAYFLFVLAAVQIVRIFIFPLQGMLNDWLKGNYYFGIAMTSPLQGVILIVYLVLSAGCFITSGVHGLIYAIRLANFQKKIDNGEVSIEETLRELDEEESNSKSEAVEAEAAGVVEEELNSKSVAVEAEAAGVVETDDNPSTEEENNG
ncbi:MAG: hypothetical protein ACI4VK_04860 [Candidatus Coproplasma sp.]